MGKIELQKHGGSLYRPSKGETANPNGRPKGKSKRVQLRKLLEDIIKLHNNKISNNLKAVVYNLYEIVLSDISLNEISDSINNLYFIESEFGIKVGISKNVQKRLTDIRRYAPDAKIIKVINYGGNFEKHIHAKFEYLNIKGNIDIGIEWFYKNSDLYLFIEEINTAKDLASIFGNYNENQLLLFK